MRNDYELVRWPPDKIRDKAEGIVVAGEEEQGNDPDPEQVLSPPRSHRRTVPLVLPNGLHRAFHKASMRP